MAAKLIQFMHAENPNLPLIIADFSEGDISIQSFSHWRYIYGQQDDIVNMTETWQSY